MFYNTEDGIQSYLFTIGAKIVHQDNHNMNSEGCSDSGDSKNPQKFSIQTKTSDGAFHTVKFTMKATGEQTTEFESKQEAQAILEGFAAGGRDLFQFRLFQPVAPIQQNQPGIVVPKVHLKGGLN